MVTAGVEKPTWQQPKHLGFNMQSWATAVCYIQPMVSSENMFLWHKQPSVQIKPETAEWTVDRQV